jgi:hypothetical protein
MSSAFSSGFGMGFQKGSVGTSGFNVGLYKPVSTAAAASVVLRYDLSNPASYPGSGTTVYDLAGNSNASLVGGPSYVAGPPARIAFLGFIGEYLITSTSLASKVTTDLTTISMWAKTDGGGVYLSELGQATPNTGWHSSVIEKGGFGNFTVKYGLWSGSGISTVSNLAAVGNNEWRNFVITYDGSKLTAYNNGVSQGSNTFARSNPVENGNGLYYAIAAPDGTNMGLSGTGGTLSLAEFTVYDGALSADDILANFNADKAKYGL